VKNNKNLIKNTVNPLKNINYTTRTLKNLLQIQTVKTLITALKTS